MNCFIGLDMGTSAVKGALVSEAGKTIATTQGEFRYTTDKNAKLLDPASFISTCIRVVNTLVKELKEGDRVAAICPCCASGNLVFIGNNDEPITPIIGWQSRLEAEDSARYLSEKERDELYHTIGWRPGDGFPLPYLLGINDKRRDLIDNAKMVAMSAEYFNFVLTGKWGIGHSMGTPSMLMDQEKGTYNMPLLERLSIKESQLPPIYDKGTVVGYVTENAAKRVKLPVGTPVVLGSFDHPSCATGAGVFNSGEMLLSCGTSWVEFFPMPSRAAAIATGKLVDRYMLDGSPYCVMISVESISNKINGLRRSLLGDISHKEFDSLAESSPRLANGLRFKFDDGDLELARGFGKEDIARAIIESGAAILKENLAYAEKNGLRADKIAMVGGMTNSATCVRIIAETLGRDIRVVNGVSAGAIGAAMLAGIGAGIFKNERDAYETLNFQEVLYRA